MEILLLSTLLPVGYVTAMILTARIWFRQADWTEPRWDYPGTTDGEKVFWSFAVSLLWPLVAIVTAICGVVWVVSKGFSKAVHMPSRRERHAAEEAEKHPLYDGSVN
jgi:hypothetical protein